ncbi:MAG TPA: hypothetical protein VLQ29_01950 [Candidatus Dormibacteraeota bacterium]|nr:hypothetical protein [Candidatus Dormibacteraeota bacterium]
MNRLPERIAISQEIRTCTELRRQIHDNLRIQLPEWVNPNGKGPVLILAKRASWSCSTL